MSWDEPKTTLLCFTKEKFQKDANLSRQFFLPESGFRFIDDHYGLRPGCFHTLMGSTGTGKSTLTQSLILEFAKKTPMLLYLTEESPERSGLKFFEKEEDCEYLSPKIHFMHERQLTTGSSGTQDYRVFLRSLEQGINESQAKLLVIDNLTTSVFYDGNFSASFPILSGIRTMAEHYQIPVFFIVHPKKGITELSKGLMEPGDVKGSSNIANTSDYFYIFYRVGATTCSGSKIYSSFVFVSKARDHDTQGNLYKLRYDSGRRRYVSDEAVNFTVFKNLMKERDKL